MWGYNDINGNIVDINGTFFFRESFGESLDSAGSLPDLETIHDLETTIQKLQLGNYSLRFRN